MPLADGAVFAGYTILRQLGAGGMGEVYLAQHPRLPRREALKILPARLTHDAEFRERFHREADIAASLWHPNVVAIHDRGEFEGQIWITMDYVEGTDAAYLLKERRPAGLPTAEALAIIRAMASALDHAHHQGLLHRDVKPANILLTAPASGERRALLADFGIARKQDEISGLTATNMTMGSVTYAAPEQLTGDPLDGRADQYALACTAFHLLAGDPPFDNSNPAVVIGKHLTADPPPLSSRRAELADYDGALARAMAKNPHQRFDTCEQFASALTRSTTASPKSEATTAMPTAGAMPIAAATVAPPVFSAQFTGRVPTAEPPVPPTSPRQPLPPWQPPPPDAETAGRSRGPLWAAVGVVAAVVLALVVFVAVKVSQPAPEAGSRPAADTSTRTSTGDSPPGGKSDSATSEPNSEVLIIEPTVPESLPLPLAVVPGDLGLSIPMTRPACDGTGIVVLFNSVTPGQYGNQIAGALARYPDASYLTTNQSCPSLRQVDGAGNQIYAIYRVAGPTQADVCAAVRAAGNDAYGKWLDLTTPPSYVIPC